jgi:hypothetical protein
MFGPRLGAHDRSMMIVLIPALLVLLSIVGAVAAGMEAASPDLATGRRVALSIVAGLLTLVSLGLAFLVYMFWALAGAFG